MSWKRAIRPATDQVAKYSGLLRACERRMRSGLTVLMYHRVLEDADCTDYPFPSLVMPRSLFEAQLDYLCERVRVLTVVDALSEGRNSPDRSKPVVCLTFDDGYVDNYEIAAPLMEARGVRGTFFVTAGAVQARTPLWYDRAAAMWTSLGDREICVRIHTAGETHTSSFDSRESWIEWLKAVSSDRRNTIMAALETGVNGAAQACPLMTADQVRDLADLGHEIGSHTLWHPILTTMAAQERRREIQGARRLLQQWTEREVTGFCYPNGDFNAEVVNELLEAGHGYACTTQPGRNREGADPFQLRRIDMTPDWVSNDDGGFDELGFRAEISLCRAGLRRSLQLRGWQNR